ncbi:MAG: type IV pilus assembly protein PilM [Fuerstiella sp.]
MAENRSAWGIDIGQAGLKAIKLRRDEDGERIRAVAFDYIPHPKILSQPDAVPQELIRQSVETFMSRNKVRNDLVGISVPGQTSLAKFIKLPPVEPNRVAEIVKYEAKQQIPFALEEVIWDYQAVGGGVEESGFMLEAEVGLFAMKRDLVYQAMEPLTEHKAEIELVQVAPLALYNFLSYDVLGFRKDEEGTEPPNAEDYYIVLDMGADNTTLLVSNGRTIWIRNVPIGGNHFTRALTREMKLTFAKAEHLKCNATKAPDPKAVFQAMRPVFNDYVTEIQRSIGYFGSVNRNARIARVIGVGNGFRMAGLQKFLQQNLQYEVQKLDDLKGVTGDGVLSDPLFIDNIMTFAVPYGLALQTLNATRIRTSLLPPEIVVQRLIRRKKPWAVGMTAGLLLAMGISTFANARVLSSVSEEKWKPGHDAVQAFQGLISSNESAYSTEKSEHEKNRKEIDDLTAPLQKRELWVELIKSIYEALPQQTGDAVEEMDPSRQRRLRIESFVQKRVENVADWHAALAATNLKESFHPDDQETAPEGEGYIITLTGHHFFNNEEAVDGDYRRLGRNFVEETLIANLRQWTLDKGGNASEKVPVRQMGITHPLIVTHVIEDFLYDPNQRIGGPGGAGGMGYSGGGMGYDGGAGYEAGGATMGPGMMGGGYPGAMGGGGIGTGGAYPGTGGAYEGGAGYDGGGGTIGAGGPGRQLTPLDKLEEEDKADLLKLRKSKFVVQFAWVPVPKDKRLPTEEETEDGASDSADDGAASE